MGYKTDVRLITTLKGFREIKKFAEQKIAENDENAEILKEPDIEQKYKDIIKLGWNDMRGNEVDLLQECMIEFMEKDITYRAMYLGENIEDIEENSYTSPKDNKKFIPYPSITREFDEEEDERRLKQYLKENENNKEEEMECE